MLDLKTRNKNQRVEVSKILQGTFDTREGNINYTQVRALAEEGELGRLPLLTRDLVPVFGRKGIKAAQLLEGVDGHDAEFIHVDILNNVYWAKLTSLEKAQLRIFAMKEDLPEEGGVRWFLTEGDMEFNVKELLRAGMPKADIITKLTCDAFKKTRIEKIIKHANASIIASAINHAVADAKAALKSGKSPNFVAICAKHNLGPEYAPRLLTGKQDEPKRGAMNFRSTRAKQTALRKAGDSLDGYISNLLEWTRNGITPPRQIRYYHMTKETAVKLANELVANAEDNLKAAQEGLKRIENIE